MTELMKQEFPVSLELGGNLTVFAVQFALIAGLMTVAQLLSVIAVIGGVTGFRFKICSAVPGVIGGALMYLAGNIVAPNDVFVGNREILGTLTCYYPYFAVIAAGILYLVIRALEVCRRFCLPCFSSWGLGSIKTFPEATERTVVCWA